MPLYEYRCTACGYKFEKIQNFSAQPETECPQCHGELIRPVTAPALRFAGAGWYVNDYAGKGAAKNGDAGETPATAGDAAAKDGKPAAKSESGSDSGNGSDKAVSSTTAAPAASSTPASVPSSTPASS